MTNDPVTCKHEDFHSDIRVNRIEDLGEFCVELQVRCTQCDTPFQFTGLQTAIASHVPCVSTFGDVVNLPMVPGRRTISESPRSIPVIMRHAATGKDVS